jgi:hypothetical protein
MSPVLRLGIGSGLLALWFGLIGPQLSHSLLQRRALRSSTITMPTLRLALKQLRRSGVLRDLAPADVLVLKRETTAIKEMSLHEEQLVAAVWILVPNKLKPGALAASQDYQGPPTQFNQRYVDPNTPALIQAVIQSYGYRRLQASLPDVRTSASTRSRQERLRATAILVKQKALTDEAAARILDATLRLSRAQHARVTRERALVAQLPAPIREIANQVHRRRVRLDQ